jgi:hypothetical protein
LQHHVHIRLFQELGEALTTSTGIVGRQLAGCFLGELCNELQAISSLSDAITSTAGKLFNGIDTLLAELKNKIIEAAFNLKESFEEAIKEAVEGLPDFAGTIATWIKNAMLELVKACLGIEIPPSCLIGPEEGCEEGGKSPLWVSQQMTLKVSPFHSCCACKVLTWE